jgi:5-methylcytosine-specific restriction endonuclease McrA
MQDVLLLNADYRPVQIVAWERAVCLLLERKAHAVASYAGRTLRSPNAEMAWPAVVTLARYARVQARVRLVRGNVLARDGFECVYCGVRPGRAALTLDHVVPRARAVDGRVTLPWNGACVTVSSWENLVTACATCNHAKADRTPAEAGLTLRRLPCRPSPGDAMRIALARATVPAEWTDFLA